MNYNKSVIVGRVTSDPSLRKTPSGDSVLTLSVATNRGWTDKNGQHQETTEFHNIVAWGKLADYVSAYLTKGSLVLVEGRLATRTWNDKNGNPRRTTEIIAEGVQFGPRPQPSKPVATPKKEYEESSVQLDGDEQDTGRTMAPLFNEGEIKPEDIPF